MASRRATAYVTFSRGRCLVRLQDMSVRTRMLSRMAQQLNEVAQRHSLAVRYRGSAAVGMYQRGVLRRSRPWGGSLGAISPLRFGSFPRLLFLAHAPRHSGLTRLSGPSRLPLSMCRIDCVHRRQHAK